MYQIKRKSLREPASFDDYWMGMAFWVGANSRSPHHNGAVVVSAAGQLLASGFDSPPKATPDGEFFRSAEKIAISDTAGKVLTGAAIFLTFTPSSEGFLDILAADIRRLVYFPSGPLDPACHEIMQQGYVQLVEYKGNLNWMRDHISVLKAAGVFS